MTSRGKEQANRDLRSELGYRLSVQVDVHDPARPLAVVHVPSLGNKVSNHKTLISKYHVSKVSYYKKEKLKMKKIEE